MAGLPFDPRTEKRHAAPLYMPAGDWQAEDGSLADRLKLAERGRRRLREVSGTLFALYMQIR